MSPVVSTPKEHQPQPQVIRPEQQIEPFGIGDAKGAILRGSRSRYFAALDFLSDENKKVALPQFLGLDNETMERFGEKIIFAKNNLNEGGFNVYINKLVEASIHGAKASGEINTNSFSRSLNAVMDALEEKSERNLKRDGIGVDNLTRLVAELEILQSEGGMGLLKKIASESVQGSTSGRSLLALAIAVAEIVNEANRERRRQDEEKQQAASLEKRKQMMEEKDVAASGMSAIVGEGDLVEKLGLSGPEAEQLLREIQKSPEFEALLRSNPGVKPESAMALTVAYLVAEKRGMQPDPNRADRGEAEGDDVIQFPGSGWKDSDVGKAA